MRVVIDTNVIVSGILNPSGIPAEIIALLVNGKLSLIYDARIIAEYEEVLSRKKFGLKRSWIAPLIDYIRNEGEYIAAEPVSEKFTDEADKKFLGLALSGAAEYLITGNRAHFPDKDIVVNPRETIRNLF